MSEQSNSISQAQVLLPSENLSEDIDCFIKLGFRLNQIFPSEDPSVAIMSGHGIQVRLDRSANCPPSTIQILTDDPEDFGGRKGEYKATNGTLFKIQPKTYQLSTPPTQHKFEIRRLKDNDPWVIGRAGMLYRDLILDRLGGSIIASHIRIPDGGPVPDMVHFHTIGFQLIFCYRGWVKLVYEDQGPPFILEAGDCVTQPPEIRHRVLEASDNLEVIEIGVPANHMTTIEHELELPTKQFLPEREFQGQKFCHHVAKEAVWTPWRIPGFESRDTGINNATKGVASVHVARPGGTGTSQRMISQDADILFVFLLQGAMDLNAEGHEQQHLHEGDAYVIPPDLKYQITNSTDELELLEVSLPGDFKTANH
jgi:quercetin dioxygenase-like cupin family protein